MIKEYKHKDTGAVVSAVQWTLPCFDSYDEVVEMLGGDEDVVQVKGCLWIGETDKRKLLLSSNLLRLDAPKELFGRLALVAKLGDMIALDGDTVFIMPGKDFYKVYGRYFAETGDVF